MPSRFGWVDFAEADRQRMLDVVHLFKEQDTRDELGIGTIRDAFADHFFPGTSTIQTRARYMLFIPWIYKELEHRRTSSSKITRMARRDEIRLIFALLGSGETLGVIGKEAKATLQRLPSSVYWSGLGSWGIRLFLGSQSQYHRRLDAYYRLNETRAADGDDGSEAPPAAANWHQGLPEAPEDLLESAVLLLTREEASFLQDRILIRHGESLLAKLAQHEDSSQVAFPWEHPALGELPRQMQDELLHARNFSETIYGAALLYNLMLARQCGNDEWAAGYEERMAEWAEMITTRWDELRIWHGQLSEFWGSRPLHLARIPHKTHVFVVDWLRLVLSTVDPEEASESKVAQQHIQSREIELKRQRARLSNPRALETWGGSSGDRQLDYRWGNAAVIVDDILEGLDAGEANDA